MEELVIQSNVNDLEKVESYLWDICEAKHITDYFGIISVPVVQAVKNSIEHGNHGDATKQVHISCDTIQSGLSISVTDEGEGFDFARSGDFPMNEGDHQGLYLIKHLADNVSYSQGCLSMEFMLSGVDERYASRRRNVLENFGVRKYVTV
ncbi:MAG: ATP-binding protein [Bacteroidales bacterium]|nr:ATP-binding protein [Bacteroidales bacterium]